jgi:hypothetical protein
MARYWLISTLGAASSVLLLGAAIALAVLR